MPYSSDTVLRGLPHREDAASPDGGIFDGLFAQKGFVAAYIGRRLDSAQDVEDYVQDVYVRVLQSAETTKVDNWRAVLARVANSVIVDRHRRDTVRHRTAHDAIEDDAFVDPRGDLEDLVEKRMRLARIRAVLEQVDACCRKAFVLARVEGFSHRDVAARLDMLPARVSRCIEKILARLARADLSGAESTAS